MRLVEKPWGRERWWAIGPRYVGKIIEVRAGHALSLQVHRLKEESMLLWEGEAVLQLAGERRHLRAGDAVDIPRGTRHRLEALTDVVIFEVSTPEVDDVIRLEDRYGRTTQPVSGEGTAR